MTGKDLILQKDQTNKELIRQIKNLIANSFVSGVKKIGER
jgi:hypothetical protein